MVPRPMRTSILWLFACNDDEKHELTVPSDPTDPGTETGLTPTGPPTTPENCPAVTDFTEAEGATLLERHLSVTLDAPGNVWVTCTSDTEAEEVHLLESTSMAQSHE